MKNDEEIARFYHWLAENDLVKFYFDNSEMQEALIDDYSMEQLSIGKSDLEALAKWIAMNPEEARSRFPKFTKGMESRIRNSSSLSMAVIIQDTPNHFPKWRSDYESSNNALKQKLISQYIELLTCYLGNLNFDETIIIDAIEKVRPELEEELTYWLNKQAEFDTGVLENIINLDNNPHPRIFKNNNAYGFFERLRTSNITKSKGAGFSFIFRTMQKEGFIYSDIKESAFREWLDDKYQILISAKLKPLEYLGNSSLRTSIYNSLKA